MNAEMAVFSVALYVFLACLGAFVGVLSTRVIAEKRRRDQERDELLKKLVPALEQFVKCVTPFSVLPKMLVGLTKVCEAQVAEVSKFREATQVIAAILGNKPRPPEDELLVPSEEDAYQAGRRQELMAKGVPPEDLETAMAVEDQIRVFGSGDQTVLHSMME